MKFINKIIFAKVALNENIEVLKIYIGNLTRKILIDLIKKAKTALLLIIKSSF